MEFRRVLFRSRRCHPLLGASILHLVGGAQDVVKRDDHVKSRAQCVYVQRTSESQGGRQVVPGAGRVDLLQDPEPLLREGQRCGHGETPSPSVRSSASATSRSTCAASSASVGWSNSTARGSSTGSRASNWVARRECPPRSKKLSVRLTMATPNRSRHIAASDSSVEPVGGASTCAGWRV